MTSALDRFSRYSPPEVARDQRAARDGFGGIGVTLDTSNDEFRITALTPRRPGGARRHPRPGDRIVAIDGVADGAALAREDRPARCAARSAAVAVTVIRPQPAQTREFQLQRERSSAPTVTVSRDGDIAVFRVTSFNQSTTSA